MIAKRIRATRESLNLTQEELAEKIGMEVLQIWRYENERTTPKGDIIAKIAKALSVTTDYLLGLSDNPTGYIEVELTPLERRALEAFRRGDVKAIIRLMPDDEPSESGN